MEKLLPRELSDSADLEKAYPSILKESVSGSDVTGDTPYVLADTNALNKVRKQDHSFDPSNFEML